jgi:hypothetical protein
LLAEIVRNVGLVIGGAACIYFASKRAVASNKQVDTPNAAGIAVNDRMHRKSINISTVLAGQRLGIKEVDEGIWIVRFMSHDLGYIDLEQKTLRHFDNPFGPRLSPMS